MTYNEYFTAHLSSNCLAPHEITAIMEEFKKLPQNRSIRFNDSTDSYGPMSNVILTGMVLTINKVALGWIDANCPMHWARPMFLSKSEREKLFKENGV